MANLLQGKVAMTVALRERDASKAPGVSSYITVGHETALLEVTVDLDAIARTIGRKALASPRGLSQLQHGAVKAKVIQRTTTRAPSARELSDYEARVQALEAQGLTRSDAQGVVDAEDMTKQQEAQS